MDYFDYRKGELCCEGVPLAWIARGVGTPVYVYSATAIRENYRRLARAFRGVPTLICYAVKANSNLAVLRELARLGAGFDIVSGGELYRAGRAGVAARRMVYSGVGKTAAEIDLALRRGILFFNVESAAELGLLAARAQRLGRRARFLIRVNPDVDPQTHPHISTGLHAHKFGVGWQEALALARVGGRWRPEVEFCGLSCHIGSQITRLAPFARALERLERLAGDLRRHGLRVRYLDFGGGIGIRYQEEKTLSLDVYARSVKRTARRLGCRLLLEPGRVIVAPAGVLLTTVLLEKKTPRRRFVVVDAAMNDLIRPALYGARHRVQAVRKNHRAASRCDVVGPVCETGDALGRDISLPPLAPGDLLAVRDAGAYGFVLSSNYNARPRAAEVLVRGRGFRVIRRRERAADLVRGET
ncbi:MAG: diaminopimelate decarboxylase [Candidatus Acidiferrales bacterium]